LINQFYYVNINLLFSSILIYIFYGNNVFIAFNIFVHVQTTQYTVIAFQNYKIDQNVRHRSKPTHWSGRTRH